MRHLGSRDVLVIDDRKESLAALLEALERAGAAVHLLEDYDEALARIAELRSWRGFGLIDLHLPARSRDHLEWLGLDLGRSIRGRFGEHALFAYITVMNRVVPQASYRYGEATSSLGIIDKYRMNSRQLAADIAAEMGLAAEP